LSKKWLLQGRVKMTSREIILKTMDLPAVPFVAAKIIQLIDNPTTSLEDLQKSIMADQGMTSRILKIANSSFYGVRQNIDTLTEALSILGLKVTRLIVLAAATGEFIKILVRRNRTCGNIALVYLSLLELLHRK